MTDNNSNKRGWRKSLLRMAAFFVFVLAVGGLGAILADRFVFPALSTHPLFSRYRILRRAVGDVTVINRTEQVVVQEDDTISRLAARAATSVVNIVSLPSGASVGDKEGMNGAGIILTSDGLVVTYRSAIKEQAPRYRVFVFDGNSYDAILIGVDEFTNLAYFKLEAQNLPVAPFADPNDVQIGKKLVVIGNAAGEYQNNYSLGILSAVNKTFNIAGKTVSSSEKLEGILEFDGNIESRGIGGMAINYRGEMVGIAGAVTIDNQDVSFLIPSRTLRQSLDRATSATLESRPYLGAYYLPITKAYALMHELPKDRGALIFSPSRKQGLVIITGSPADKAGLLVGDIVLALNNQEINLDNPLSNVLAGYKKGDLIELTVFRSEQELKIPVQL